jgi:Bacteriophage T4-like portal protein (Gp20)
MSENLTIFQRLGVLLDPQASRRRTSKPVKVVDPLLVTQSPEEFKKTKTELQQQKYLSDMWSRVDTDMYTKSLHNEPTRLAAYFDFDSMEFFPELSASLDLYSEEATCPSEQGKVLTIFSESERVRSALQELFNKTLDIETNLQSWTRTTVKYGDNFVLLHLDREHGIVGCSQLPVADIDRVEDGDITDHKKQVSFKYRSKNLTFQPFQVAHFRLMGDDRKLPYGCSILEKARRIYRQLIMVEDAMLVYRVVRAPERRVFKVFVGNMDDTDVEAYIQKIANKFKRTPIIDGKTGQIDLRYNQSSVDTDIFVPTRSESNQTVIDTLPGAQPLPIDDIEYLQSKLFAAIRVPKPFLGFTEAAGDGKNLSLLDIRFSRSVNRVQKAMIQELNKIAIIHLFMLGYEEDLDNFTLALTNPSTQAELLKIEQWSQKIDLYSKSVADAGNGFSAISMVKAKKDILGMSDEEITLDLQQQRIEKAAAAELANTDQVIVKTGIFDKVDKIYGIKQDENTKKDQEKPKEDDMGDIGGFGGGGGVGPSSFGGGGSSDFGSELGGEETPEGEENPENPEGEKTPEDEEKKKKEPQMGGPDGVPQEGFIGRRKPLITERLTFKTDTYNKEMSDMIKTIDDIIKPDEQK